MEISTHPRSAGGVRVRQHFTPQPPLAARAFGQRLAEVLENEHVLRSRKKNLFTVEIIKPSHYDDDGYVIQWFRTFIPSELPGLPLCAGAGRDKTGTPWATTWRSSSTPTMNATRSSPTRKIIRRIRANGGRGVVLLAGVQSNQFPRAADLAREQFRDAGIPVVVGGFHVSGCLAMLSELPAKSKASRRWASRSFAGEAEGRHGRSASGRLSRGMTKPVYNYLGDLPELQGQVTPDSAARGRAAEHAVRPLSTAAAAARSSAASARSSTSRAASRDARRRRRGATLAATNLGPGVRPVLHHRRQLRAQPELGSDLRPPHRDSASARASG